jgi:hypothetical protein
LVAIFVLALSISVLAGTGFVVGVKANFFWWMKGTTPDEYTEPPVISIVSPENNTVFNEDSVFLSFSVDVGKSETADITHLDLVGYERDWVPDNTTWLLPNKPYPLVHEVNLTGIPEGKHTITIQAIEKGVYESGVFTINSSETVHFTIDTSSETKIPEFPQWTILPLALIATFFVLAVRKRLFRLGS